MIKVTCLSRKGIPVAVFRANMFHIAMTSLYLDKDPRHVARYDPESNRWRLNLIDNTDSFASLVFDIDNEG